MSDYPKTIKTTLVKRDIEWEMNWSTCLHLRKPKDPVKEMQFEENQALALLLINEIVFINSYWPKDWPEKAKDALGLHVNCNDIFAWGCADAEEMSKDDIKDVYDYYVKDPIDGPSIWCIIKRKQLPQDAVAKSIQTGGIWDLDQLKIEHELKNNYYSGISSVVADLKYKIYCAWAKENQTEPLPFDKHWWSGWKLFTEANPDWHDDDYKAKSNLLIKEFQVKNGYEITNSGD